MGWLFWKSKSPVEKASPADKKPQPTIQETSPSDTSASHGLKRTGTDPRLWYSSGPSEPNFEEKFRIDLQSLDARVNVIEESMMSQKQGIESCTTTLEKVERTVTQLSQTTLTSDLVTKADLDVIVDSFNAQMEVGKATAANWKETIEREHKQEVNEQKMMERKIEQKAQEVSQGLDEMRLAVSQIEEAWAKVEDRLEEAMRRLDARQELDEKRDCRDSREKALQEQIFELAQCRLERDAGQLKVQCSCAEWVVPHVRAKADLMPKGTCVTSPLFAAELASASPGCRPVRLNGLRIDFYPSGRESSQQGFCSVALRSEEGFPWVRYWLSVGGFRRGPLDPLTEVVDDICPLTDALVGESGKEMVRLTVEFIESQPSLQQPGYQLEALTLAKQKQTSFHKLSNQKLPPFPGLGVAAPKVTSLWSESNRGQA